MQPAHSGSSERAKVMLAGGFLFALVFCAFLPAVQNQFLTYDDPEYVTANPYVQQGLTPAGLKWAFSAHGANWHPITWLSHMLDGQIFGLRPWGHHLTNIWLHALNTFLAFWVLRKLTGATWRSFFVALLFGLHPLRVESVAWVAERKDVLSVLFFFLTLWAYAEYTGAAKGSRKARISYALALLAFVLGLLSKSMLVTLPFVLLLLDYWPLKRIALNGIPNQSTIHSRQSAIEKLPFFAVSAAMCVIARVAQRQGTALVSSLSLASRVENALVSYCRYLAKIFWPVNLSPLYPGVRSWPLVWVLTASLFLALVSIYAVLRRKQQPWIFVGWFWYLGTLVPIIGLIQIGEQSIADRYTYIPSLGIFITVIWSAYEWTKDRQVQLKLVTVAGSAAAIVCLVLTQMQIPYWRTTENVFARAVAVTQNNTLALVGLGACLAERGEYEQAIVMDRRALEASPAYYEAHNNLGLALTAMGKLDEAMAEYRLAMKDRPGAPDCYLNLGIALVREQRYDEAAEQLNHAAALDASNPLPHVDLAAIFVQQGKLDAAIEQFRAALKLDPQNANLHNDLGTALARSGQLDPAIAEFQTVLKLNPAHPNAAANLARAQNLKNQPSTTR